MTSYPIEIAEHNSAGIRVEAQSAGITHMRKIASGSLRGQRATLYAMPSPEYGGEVRVLDTNGDPVWEENDPAAFAETLAKYGLSDAD